MKKRPALIVRKEQGRGHLIHVTLPLDQKNYEVGCYSGRGAYLWMGPTEGAGTILTLDVSDMKRLLRKAGHI